MNARALVLAAILQAPGLAFADGPPPAPAPPAEPPETEEEYCERRCRSRAGCFGDDRCRVYLERTESPERSE